MIYKAKNPAFIRALQYKDNTSLEIPKANNLGKCNRCKKPLNEHGFLNGTLICPDYFIIHEGSIITNILSPEQFNSAFEPVGEVVSTIETN